MATGWVPAFDESYQRVPVSRMDEAYTAGYRVIGGYAGGGSTSKWLTRPEITAWLAQGPDTGIAALFEIGIADAVNYPSRGGVHAKAARAAWRALGYPDDAAIFVAVDTNVTLAEARNQLVAYFRNWVAADTCKPVPYVEADAGLILFDAGLTAGTFTPAAWGWNDPAVLYTPANALGHVVWTQEHNGRLAFGGDLDVGHIRTSAPIWWSTSDAHGDVGVDMALTQADADLVAAALLRARIDNLAPPKVGEPVSLGQATRMTYFREGYEANTAVPAEAAALAALTQSEQGLSTTLAALPAAVAAAVAALPGAGAGGTLTEADVEAAVHAELAKLTLNQAP